MKSMILSGVLTFAVVFSFLVNPVVVCANELPENEQTMTFEQDDGSVMEVTPLSDERVAELLDQANEPQPRFENEVYAMPVKVDKDRVAVDFTNRGFILDFVDIVETNLIIWHARDNNPVGYKVRYIKLPAGTHRSTAAFVANWHSAQVIGGFYIDGFGTEIGIGGASSIIYN